MMLRGNRTHCAGLPLETTPRHPKASRCVSRSAFGWLTPQAQLQGQLRQDIKRLNRDIDGGHDLAKPGTCQLQRMLACLRIGIWKPLL